MVYLIAIELEIFIELYLFIFCPYNKNVILNVLGSVMTQDVTPYVLLFVNHQNAIQAA